MSQVADPGSVPVAAESHLSSKSGAPYAMLVRRLAAEGAPQAIGLTSCAHKEGVSTVAANLAVAAASEPGGQVLLIDTKRIHSQTEAMFGLPSGPGFSEWLSGRETRSACIQATSVPKLHVMGPGRQVDAARSTVPAQTFRALLARLKQDYAWVVFDLPIVSECQFPGLVASLDGILLVVEAERLRRRVVLRAKQQLEDSQAHVTGVVFNKQQTHLPNWLRRRF